MSMSMRPQLRTEMKQTMKMSPQMIQSMNLLQLPILALQERIDQEMLENPALETQDDDSDYDSSDIQANNSDSDYSSDSNNDSGENIDHEIDDSLPDSHELENKDNSDDEFQQLLNSDDDPQSDDFSYERSHGSSDDASEQYTNMLANMAARSETLQDHLLNQLSWFDLTPEQAQRCEKIITVLDDRGYIAIKKDTNQRYTLEEIFPELDSESFPLAVAALNTVQHLDPPGVGARSIKECLLLQLRPEQPFYVQLKTLIENHLSDLEQNKLPQICKAAGFSMDMLQTLIDEMRTLTVNPGADFQNSVVASITPDAYVTHNPEGGYKVSIEDSELPHLKISPFYKKLGTSDSATQVEQEYIKQKIAAAQWLIDSIEQRNNTILKVCQAIVDYQQAFFDKGPDYIKPLKLEQIAEKIGMHTSTVQRTVDDKWIQTPRGLFPLRHFFGGGKAISADKNNSGSDAQSADNQEDEVAYSVIRMKIKELVDAENKANPLSDDAISDQLAAMGFNVARRTIAKYRSILNIPSSRQRKDWSGQ